MDSTLARSSKPQRSPDVEVHVRVARLQGHSASPGERQAYIATCWQHDGDPSLLPPPPPFRSPQHHIGVQQMQYPKQEPHMSLCRRTLSKDSTWASQ
jgi:hypothetical protein